MWEIGGKARAHNTVQKSPKKRSFRSALADVSACYEGAQTITGSGSSPGRAHSLEMGGVMRRRWRISEDGERICFSQVFHRGYGRRGDDGFGTMCCSRKEKSSARGWQCARAWSCSSYLIRFLFSFFYVWSYARMIVFHAKQLLKITDFWLSLRERKR